MNRQPDHPRQRNLIAPALAYGLVSLSATWPLLTHLKGWVPGLGDWGQNMWALWWTRQALLDLGQSPFHTNYLFYPEGVTLLFHPLDVADGLLALPLYGLLGGDITYNVMILLSFALGGWSAYLLALHLTRQRAASFVAGLVFTLSPYHFLRVDLGHLNLATIQWIPLYVLCLIKFLESGSKRFAALAIFFMGFTALHSWYYVIYAGILSLALLLWPGREKVTQLPARFWLTRGTRLGLVLGLAGLLLLPLVGPMFQLMSATVLVGSHNPLRHSVDLFSFFIPGPPLAWAGWFEEGWVSYAAQNREPGASAYAGFGVLALSLLALLGRRRRRAAGWWTAVALGFTLLGLGPQLQMDGQILTTTLPYHWLARLVPIFSITGIPGRFVLMTSLALAILSAYGLANLTEWLAGAEEPAPAGNHQVSHSYTRRRSPRWGLGFCLAAGLLIGLEYLAVPLRLSSTALPTVYQRLAADSEPYAILDIKWDANFLMHAQTRHGKPIVGGWLARLPAEQAAYLDQGSLEQAFIYLLVGPEGGSLPPEALPETLRQALAARQVRYIINHDERLGNWLGQSLNLQPLPDQPDESVTVYALPLVD